MVMLMTLEKKHDLDTVPGAAQHIVARDSLIQEGDLVIIIEKGKLVLVDHITRLEEKSMIKTIKLVNTEIENASFV